MPMGIRIAHAVDRLVARVILQGVGLALVAAGHGAAQAQIPCRDPQSIGCDYHPDHGWIVRGSAPARSPSEPARQPQRESTPAPRPLSEAERRQLEAARASDRARAALEQRFRDYVERCIEDDRLGQPACWAAAEHEEAQAATWALQRRMSQRQWEDYRLYGRPDPVFLPQIRSVDALATAAQGARADWDKGLPPDPAQVQGRLSTLAALRAERAKAAFVQASLLQSLAASDGGLERCLYRAANGHRFEARYRPCPALVTFNTVTRLVYGGR